MANINHAVILAAGRGRRMMPLTEMIPKAMAPYQGSTLIAQGIARIAKVIENVHVTVGYKGALLAQHVIQHGASTVFNTEGKTNAWWIYHTVLRHLDEPVYVLTCDNVVELDFGLLEEEYFGLNEPAGMLVPVKPVPGLEGDYVVHADHVVKAISRTTPSDMYCSGIQIVNPYRLNQLTREQGDFYTVWTQLIEIEQLFVSSLYPKQWFAVDTVEQWNLLNSHPGRLDLGPDGAGTGPWPSSPA